MTLQASAVEQGWLASRVAASHPVAVPSVPSIVEFRHLALGFWADLAAADSRSANRKRAGLDRLVTKWRGSSDATVDLVSLLEDPEPAVRYAAASYLGAGDPAAVEVLVVLASDPKGLIAPTAKLLLAQWGVRMS